MDDSYLCVVSVTLRENSRGWASGGLIIFYKSDIVTQVEVIDSSASWIIIKCLIEA